MQKCHDAKSYRRPAGGARASQTRHQENMAIDAGSKIRIDGHLKDGRDRAGQRRPQSGVHLPNQNLT